MEVMAADRKLLEAERQIGRLTMELEVWQSAGRKRGAPDPAKEAAEVSAETGVALARVCQILRAPCSSVYARRRVVASGSQARSANRAFSRRAAGEDPCR